MDVRIRTLDPIRVARIRHVGPYREAGACFERLFRWAQSTGAPTGRVLTLAYDDPGKVEPERLRSDVCVELRTDEQPPPGIAMGRVGGGRHAVYRVTGRYEAIARAYGRLVEEWLGGSGESMGDGPCMALHRHAVADTPQRKRVTDLCVPLRKKKACG